jgi:hypothetical protein
MCEGCNDTVASFGIAGDRVKRWCASCGKAHGAVRLSARKMCEGCGYKLAHHGAAINRVKRWCASCGKEHSSGEEEAGAVEAAAGGFGLFGGGSTIFDFFFFFGIVPPSAPAALAAAAAAPSPHALAPVHKHTRHPTAAAGFFFPGRFSFMQNQAPRFFVLQFLCSLHWKIVPF